MRHLLVGSALCVALSLTACGTAGPAPSASPTFVCTPPAGGGAPSPCSQAQRDAMVAQDALYAEAEQVYRKFFDQEVLLLKTGQMPTGETYALLGGPMVAKFEDLQKGLVSKAITAEGDYRLAYVRPSSVALYEGTELALETCEDASQLRVLEKGVYARNSGIVQGHAYFKRVGSALRVWWTDGRVVPSC